MQTENSLRAPAADPLFSQPGEREHVFSLQCYSAPSLVHDCNCQLALFDGKKASRPARRFQLATYQEGLGGQTIIHGVNSTTSYIQRQMLTFGSCLQTLSAFESLTR